MLRSHVPSPGGEQSSARFLFGLLLLAGVAFLIWQNWSLARQVTNLASALRELDARVDSSSGHTNVAPVLQPSLVLNPGIADEVAERVLARMSATARPAEPEATAGPDKGTAPVSASEDRANEVVDAAIRGGKLRQQDVLAIRELLAKAGDIEASRRVGARIAAAINRDELHPESADVMFP